MRVGFFIERPGSEVDAEKHDDIVSVEASPQDEIILEEVRRRYDLQQSVIDSLNTKAGMVLAYLGAVLVLLVVTDSAAVMKAVLTVQSPVFYLALLTVLLCLASLVCCFKALVPRKFFPPVAVEPDRIEGYLAMDRENMLLQLLADYGEYIQRNEPEIKRRSQWFQASLVFGLVFTVVGACTALLA